LTGALILLGVVATTLLGYSSVLRRRLAIKQKTIEQLLATETRLRGVVRSLDGIDRSRKATVENLEATLAAKDVTLDKAMELVKNQGAALGADPLEDSEIPDDGVVGGEQ